MGWRYYAQRPVSGMWLDNNVQLSDVELQWVLSAPNAGSALIPNGLDRFPVAEDNKYTWSRFNTLLYAEEDGKLEWVGVCTAANPDAQGLHLEFMGVTGLLQRIPYTDIYRRWKIDVFNVVRHLLAHARQKPDTLDIIASGNDAKIYVGDLEPPSKPRKPTRKKGETKKEFQASKRYKEWQKKQKAWDKKYGGRKKYELLKWEAPYVGEEIDALAKETQFEYREEYRWKDGGNRQAEFKMVLDVDMVRRRDDIEFTEGVNLAKALDPKDGNDTFANRVIGLGAGEGQKMVRVNVGGADGRLYQAVYSSYKHIKDKNRLQSRVTADLKIFKSTDPEVDSVDVWDTPGMADIKSLRVGDEVKINSAALVPPVHVWARVTRITRRPESNIVTLDLERAA